MKAPYAVLVLAAGLVLVIDQVAKAIVRNELTLCSAPPVRLCDRVELVGPFGFLRTENGDGAFGLLDGALIGPVLLLVVGILLWRIAVRGASPLLMAAVGLQLGGLAANLADRALFGTVTDFLDIRVGLTDKGLVLNPADIGLAVGGVVVALLLTRPAGPRNGDPVSHAMGIAPDGGAVPRS